MDNTNFRKYLTVFLSLTVSVIFLVFFLLPDNNLHVIACDVGQGDAILITNKNNQILIDGGPDNSVLTCLGKYMPFYDREIEMVILTHPQTDHYTGFIEVFRRYRVDIFVANSVDADTSGYQVLKKEVGGMGIKVVNSYSGLKMRLGLIHIDIVNPSEDLGKPETPGRLGVFKTKRDLNDFSVLALISFGSFKGIFTGDIGANMNSEILKTRLLESVDYIKIPHHGSKYGISKELLDILEPKIAIISVGKNNRYDHPHKETLDLLNSYQVKTLRTDQMGDVEVISDGKNYWIK